MTCFYDISSSQYLSLVYLDISFESSHTTFLVVATLFCRSDGPDMVKDHVIGDSLLPLCLQRTTVCHVIGSLKVI